MSDDTKSRSEIDKRLSEEQREAFFALVESSTLKEGADWLEHRYELKLSPTAVGKWAEKQRRKADDFRFRQLLGDLRHDTQQASVIAAQVGNAAQLNEANVVMLSQALFSARRTGDPGELKAAAKLFSMVLEANAKSKAAEASVIAAETSRDKFQYDAAKAALAKAAELKGINDSVGSEREKVLRAIETVFGRRPAQTAGETTLAGDDLASSDRPSSDLGSDLPVEVSHLQAGVISQDNFITRGAKSSKSVVTSIDKSTKSGGFSQ